MFLVSRLPLHEAFQFLVSTKTKGGAKKKLFSHQNETKDFLKMDMDSNHEVCTRLSTVENTKTTLRTSPRRYVLKIHFFIESGRKMIQFKIQVINMQIENRFVEVVEEGEKQEGEV